MFIILSQRNSIGYIICINKTTILIGTNLIIRLKYQLKKKRFRTVDACFDYKRL